MKKRMIFVGLILLILFGGVFSYDAWRSYMGQIMAQKFKLPPITISSMKAESKTWQDTIQGVGTLTAINSVMVTSDISGKIRNILFVDGSMVEKDQPLVQLDDELLQQQLKDNEAQLELSKLNLERSKNLYSKRAVPKRDLDANQAEFIKYSSAVASDKISIKFKTVAAPFRGKIGLRQVDVGDYLEPGKSIVALESLDPINVDFTIPQRYLANIRNGQNIKIKLDSYPNSEFDGKVIALDAKVNQSTRNIMVRGQLSNPEHKFAPGQFAEVRLLTGISTQVTVIPRTAIAYSTYGDVVYVIIEKDGKKIAEQRPVQLGHQQGDWVIVEKGLNPGDEIAVSGLIKLRPGSAVTIDNSHPLQFTPWK